MTLFVPLPQRILLESLTLGRTAEIEYKRDTYQVRQSAYYRAVVRLYDRLYDRHERFKYRPPGFLGLRCLPPLPKIPNPFASRPPAPMRPAVDETQAAEDHPFDQGPIHIRRFGNDMSDDDLINKAVTGDYSEDERLPLLYALSHIVENTNRTKSNRYMAAIQIAKRLGVDDTLPLNGAEREAYFFASYAIDLILQEMDSTYSKELEELFRDTLKLWVHDLMPERQEFNLDGIVRTREELNILLFDEHFFEGASNSDAWRNTFNMESLLKTNDGESVLTSIVKDTGAKVLAKMEEKTAPKHVRSLQRCVDEITKQSTLRIPDLARRDTALGGLNIASRNYEIDDQWCVKRSPASVLPSVWCYIQSNDDTAFRSKLKDAFYNKLYEIRAETPCTKGQLQRLLDVPTGIDPDMDQFGAELQMVDELASIAGKVNERLDKLIEEDARFAKSRQLKQLSSPIGKVGSEVFRHQVEQDVGRFRGVNVRKLEADIQHLEQGFKPMD